jgi:hypothetical protein
MPAISSRAEERIHGRAALEAVGMPLEFAAQVMLLASELGIAIAIRAGKPFQLYLELCKPKPSYVKAKTGNWGFMKGVIAADPLLAKMNASKELLIPPPMPSEVNLIQHTISLSEILTGLQKNNPEFELVSLDPELSPVDYVIKTNQLVVKPTKEYCPFDSEFYFGVHLNESNPPLNIDRRPIRTNLFEETPVTPLWWQPQWGNFAEQLSYRYPAYVKKENETFKPLEIYAVFSDSKNCPVTGDMDLLWVTKPKQESHLFPQSAHQVLNTSNLEACAKMLESLIELHQYFAEQRDEVFNINEISSESIGREGCLTPFESFFITTINARFAEYAEHINNLFQHGAENRNPGKPSDLDGPVLHIWNGEVILTESEKDLVDFVLNTPGYLEHNFIDIHPGWNMELWRPVIEKQIMLGQFPHFLEKIPLVPTAISLVNKCYDLLREKIHPHHDKYTSSLRIVRNHPVGRYDESKRLTAKENLAALEKFVGLNQEWHLDKTQKKLVIHKNNKEYIVSLNADEIDINICDATSISILMLVLQVLHISENEIIVHAQKTKHKKEFEKALQRVYMKDKDAIVPSARDLDALTQKIDDILVVTQDYKLNKPHTYAGLFGQRTRPRRLSFNADAKAQHAWLGFFKQKTTDMNDNEKIKFVRTHHRLQELFTDFNEAEVSSRLRSG